MYVDLSSCRSMGWSMGPIPWTAMVQWCDHHNLERDVADFVVSVMRLVDADTLRRAAERAKADATPPRGRGKLGE